MTRRCYHYRPDHNGECLNCDEWADAHPPLICGTCHQPIADGDDAWSWMDGRRRDPEHDACYRERFARTFPTAPKWRKSASRSVQSREVDSE